MPESTWLWAEGVGEIFDTISTQKPALSSLAADNTMVERFITAPFSPESASKNLVVCILTPFILVDPRCWNFRFHLVSGL
jgi:hypothetical protein